MSREAELSDKTNNELRELLDEYEQPTDGNKAELVDRIVRFESGVADLGDDEAPENVDVDENEEVAANEADVADTPPEPEAEEPEGTDEDAESEGDSSGVLVRYTGKSSYYEQRGQVFSTKHPYAVVSKEEAERLVQNKPRLFRTATEGEVAKFYE